MGAGKTTVGRLLAARLGWPFVDLDAVVEKAAGMTIPAIFEREGEDGFRRRETEAVRAVTAHAGQVIATGGGTVMRRENLALLRATGTLVWLRAPLEVLLARARAEGGRPLLAEGDDAAAKRYAARVSVYALADVVVDATQAPDAVAAEIEARLSGAQLEPPEMVPVPAGSRSYAVHVGAELLASSGRLAREVGLGGKALVVTNPTVGAHYATPLMNGLAAAGFSVHRVDIPDGEEHKTLASAERIYRAAVAARLERRDFFVALGGGVVGDAAGFAAATYLRGVDVVQVPTTLLAQVDASVGGKVGVNLAEGKNLVGAFHQPRLVVADVAVLATLPQRELVAGLAEVIKYGAIADPHLLAFLEDRLDDIVQRRLPVLARVVARSCEIKARVVAADERETRGVREVLNFGHTIGHAIEALTGYRRYLHGEAVAIGMVSAALLAQRMGRLAGTEVERLIRLLRRAGLPTTPPPLDETALLAVLQRDKKVRDGRLRFVLLDGLGQAFVTGEVPSQWIKDVLLEQRAL
ncbi:MAG: 3-dehydroquinate synthase [Firmicutes bacterium ZCTH02-B6]|nr:MAG: 3-dehydroquinate synthase [Firmicutes bacterium ZCTH02-B6]